MPGQTLMPFRSEAQRRYLWANEPQVASRWAAVYGDDSSDRGRASEGWERAFGAATRGAANCRRTGTVGGGRYVWIICDRAGWSGGRRRFSWWVRDNLTMRMSTGRADTYGGARQMCGGALRAHGARS